MTQASTAVRRDSTSHRATTPTVLAVIPTRNAGPRLADLLYTLRGTPVLVLDTASTDGTPERARSHGAQVRAIAPEAFNHATTRNLALEYPADFYLFLTQDAVPVGSDLTCALLEPMEDPQVAMAYGRHLPPSQCRPEERFARLYHYPPHSQVRTRAHIPRLGIHAFFASNVCCLYRASVFRALGGFTPGLPTNEDMEFAARALLAGYAVAYAAEACVWHGHHLSLAQLWRRYNVAAADFTGDLEIDLSGSSTLESVVTGAGNDDVTVAVGELAAAKNLDIDLGEGENTLSVVATAALDAADLTTLVFTGDDLSISGVSTLAIGAITLTGDGTLDLDGIAPSALVFEGAVDVDGNTLLLDNTAAALDITFESTVDNGTLDFGDAAETVVLTAEGVTGGTTLVELTGEALVDLTVNAEADADFDVAATAAALEAVAINANEDGITITSTINGDAAEETSLTSLSLTDASEAGDAEFDITLVNTLNLATIDLAGGVDTVFTIDASLAAFAGTVTINIGDFGVDADGVVSAAALLDYTADTAGTLREVFKFVGEDFGNVKITDFLAGVGGNADRLDFSAFDGVDGLDDLNLAVNGSGDTVITSDAFEGTITVVGVDLSTDAFNFIF